MRFLVDNAVSPRTDKRPSSQLRSLLAHLSELEQDLTAGSIVVLEDERIRIRALPIAKEQ
jgi:hypothetical protein